MGYLTNIFGAGRARGLSEFTAPSDIVSPYAPQGNLKRLIISLSLIHI